jgi:propionyl-CoA carboxylase alpha chain/3-methylcrotonyl-CoA carboxylase alpha subunit/acetyl-CoA/propionyl-CoA carboxylase biotin carboxyl carrier protein
LPFAQRDIRASGHAIECRICAENPERDYMPETGTIHYLAVKDAPFLRFENALSLGQKVGSEFDPMLAKLVVHAVDRERAIAQMIDALADLAILGVRTNVEFLGRVLAHPAFAAGQLHTGFLAEHAHDLAPSEPEAATLDKVVIAAALGFTEFREQAFSIPEPYGSIGRWRN